MPKAYCVCQGRASNRAEHPINVLVRGFFTRDAVLGSKRVDLPSTHFIIPKSFLLTVHGVLSTHDIGPRAEKLERGAIASCAESR